MKINERRRGKQTRGLVDPDKPTKGNPPRRRNGSQAGPLNGIAGVAPGPLTLTRVILTDPRWPFDRCEPVKPEYEEALL